VKKTGLAAMKRRESNLHAFLLLSLSLFVYSASLHAEWQTAEKTLMGTQVSVELWSNAPEAGLEAIDAVFTEVERLDLMMNPWNTASELARINREAGNHPVITTAETIEVVARALYYSRMSEGAFDISFASVGQYYEYREGKSPSASQVAQAKQDIDFRAIRLNPDTRSISFDKPGLQIDLGGIAKGYAMDRAVNILRKKGITSAVVAAGGDTRILGDLGNRPRTIGIRHPRKEDEFVVMIPLENTAISTSGDYERFFIKDGVRVHHILDPDTGRSSKGAQSVSVLSPLGIDSDALSTTTFVLGLERGLALINSLPGVDAIIIDGEGKLHYSDALLLKSK
jgi:thiamine biosynthesis lipoprotein